MRVAQKKFVFGMQCLIAWQEFTHLSEVAPMCRLYLQGARVNGARLIRLRKRLRTGPEEPETVEGKR
jgi:hypothetical protein